MMAITHTDAAILFLRMQPTWVVIDEIRRFVSKFCQNACPEAGREEQVALAAHELVQNAIANAATPDIEVKLEVDRSHKRVVVSVSNLARADQIAILRGASTGRSRTRMPSKATSPRCARTPSRAAGSGSPASASRRRSTSHSRWTANGSRSTRRGGSPRPSRRLLIA